MLPRHRDIADAAVEYDATPTDYALVAIRVLPALAIAVTPFLAFGASSSCTSRLPPVDCSAIDRAAVSHTMAQVACLAVGWILGRREGPRWPVRSVACVSVLAALASTVYAITVPG